MVRWKHCKKLDSFTLKEHNYSIWVKRYSFSDGLKILYKIIMILCCSTNSGSLLRSCFIDLLFFVTKSQSVLVTYPFYTLEATFNHLESILLHLFFLVFKVLLMYKNCTFRRKWSSFLNTEKWNNNMLTNKKCFKDWLQDLFYLNDNFIFII